MTKTPVIKIVAHSRTVLNIATAHGWLPGARYTNLRDIRHFGRLGFLDINWKNYNFEKHMHAVKETRPFMTVARDIEDRKNLSRIIDEAYKLLEFCNKVILVPKDLSLSNELEEQIPSDFVLGFSVPTKYGGTHIPTSSFVRPTHLLGGGPDIQRRLANSLPVFSFDVNRFTLDAAFGDFFDGQRFRPHPIGGYINCLTDSIKNITSLWDDYEAKDTSNVGKIGSRIGGPARILDCNVQSIDG